MAKAIKTAPRKAPAKAAEVAAKPAPVRVTAPAPVAGAQPAMRILAQYIKDLSFENPNAPASLAPQQKQPEINISVNVNARNLGPSDFEVDLHIDAKASADGK
ncbi:MAG: protein-export chaperone SecB, partial [Aestuariivirga sp.]